MSQPQVVSSGNLKTMLRKITGQDYDESMVIAVQKLLEDIYANKISRIQVHEESKAAVHSTWSPTETELLPSAPSLNKEVLVLVDNNDPLVAEARKKVQGCLHSAIYDLYVYRNHTRRNYNILFHVGQITPSEVAVLGSKGAKVESFRIVPFSDELWSVHFDFEMFI